MQFKLKDDFYKTSISDPSKAYVIGCTMSTKSTILARNISYSYAVMGTSTRLDQCDELHFQILVEITTTPQLDITSYITLIVLDLNALG